MQLYNNNNVHFINYRPIDRVSLETTSIDSFLGTTAPRPFERGVVLPKTNSIISSHLTYISNLQSTSPPQQQQQVLPTTSSSSSSFLPKNNQFIKFKWPERFPKPDLSKIHDYIKDIFSWSDDDDENDCNSYSSPTNSSSSYSSKSKETDWKDEDCDFPDYPKEGEKDDNKICR